MTWVKVFAPASIANLGPGFDCLGVAIAGPGDTVAVRRAEGGRPGVVITQITGHACGIPLEAGANGRRPRRRRRTAANADGRRAG